MSKSTVEFRDLVGAFAIQTVALLFASMMLDMGQWGIATADISAGFGCGVIIVFLRRHRSLTLGDHNYIRFGLLPLLMVGIPVTLVTWHLRGLG